MTVPIRIEQKCCICGCRSNQTVLASTNRFGAPDLDLRPPQMMRSTMGWWIHECPECGYVSVDLEQKPSGISNRNMRNFLKSDRYTSCNGMNITTDLGKQFIKSFLIHAYAGKWEMAFSDIHHAAWACDDASDKKNAIICRKIAVKCSKRFPLDETMKTVIADIMRRAGLFKEMVMEYEHIQVKDETLCRVIKFEIEKAKARDAKRYTLDDISPGNEIV